MMSWVFVVVQGFEHHELRRATRRSLTRGSVSVKSRHELVPQFKGQSVSRPERLVTQPCPDCFSRPRASRSSSRGRCVGLVFLSCAPSFSSLFFRFSVLISRELSGSRGCAVATSAIRGVCRGGCVASPYSGTVPPGTSGQWHQELRTPTQEPRILQVSLPQYRCIYFLMEYPCSWSSVSCICPP